MLKSLWKSKLIQKPIEIVRENKKLYITMNVAFYGLLAISMFVAWVFPDLQAYALVGVDQDLSTPLMESTVVAAYNNGNILWAVFYTFLINLIVGSFLTMTLPSLIIPFSGLLMGFYRAGFWGLLFSPFQNDISLIPHYLTLIIEGQAYILVMFAILIQGKSFLFPKDLGLECRWSGYKHGLVQTAWLYIPIVVVLLLGAIYEAIEVISILPLFE